MKLTRIISLMLVFVMLALTISGCNLFDFDVPEETKPTEQSSTKPTDSTSATTKPTESTTSTTDKGDNPDPDEDPQLITIAEAIEIAKAETSKEPTVRYLIRATIVKVSNPTYGEMTIADETGEIYVYGTYSADGVLRYSEMDEKPVKGDEVLLSCTLNTYEGTPQVKNGRIIEFTKAPKEDIDTSAYTAMSILDARAAEVGTKISVTGVVARITYANGMKPSGVYLVDDTNSIYVYDADIAGQVSIGNKITVLGSKTYWVLDSEQNNANKFGYKGCCQLEEALLYENDNGTNEIDFSWCREAAVKKILELPVSENYTTTIYKTNALVKKVPGSGFVNYYFFDLDGETGAYTYTQCNGNDFAWLDEFDGKICTVYLSPMNAKSTATDCFFRFLPIAVIDEGFEFDVARAPMHVVEYYCVDQFLSTYTGNPLKELPASVSSELLGFDNVTVTYTSDNESVVFFTVENPGTVILNCGVNGTATVTITATYGDYTYSDTVEITVDAPVVSEGLTVEQAIGTTVGETIKVAGIVGPSLVNQSGFYIIDETGALPVRVDASQFEGLAVGQKVVVEGTMSITKDGGGQLCLDSATIFTNYYGKHDYSTESFIKDATMEEIKALPDNPSSTVNVYVITAKVTRKVAAYSTTYSVGDVLLYSGDGTQYSWLGNFFAEGENEVTLTVELAICDWNNKGLKGCVLAVITEDGKIYNELNFTAN